MRAIFFFNLETNNATKRLISIQISKDKEIRKAKQKKEEKETFDLLNPEKEDYPSNTYYFNPSTLHPNMSMFPQNSLYSNVPQQQFGFGFPFSSNMLSYYPNNPYHP